MPRRLAAIAFAVGVLNGLTACSSVDTKFGKLEKAPSQFAPSDLARACKVDKDCVEVDYACGACCPGGAAINRKFLDIFKRNHKDACASLPKQPVVKDCTCVMAPLRCLKAF